MNLKNDHSIIFAYDIYLGFPTEDPYWKQFFQQHNIILQPYNDIDKMMDDLRGKYITAAFLPAGGFYYLRHENQYTGIASASLANNQLTETCYFLVRKNSAFKNIEELRHKNLAYINHECTTSFFGSHIFLLQHHFSPANFFGKMISVDGFHGQMKAMNSSMEVDATMLWDLYWMKNKTLQENTRIIGKISDLPTPVVIFNLQGAEALKKAFLKHLLEYQSNNSWIYTGFAPYQTEINQQFWKNIDS